MMSPEFEKKQALRGNIIEAAFDELELLGHTFSMVVLKYLVSKGVVFDNKHYYSLEQLEKLLVGLFGLTVTPILIERLSFTKQVLVYAKIQQATSFAILDN